MARTDTLGNFLTDVAEAIRTKEGTTETIAASEFDTRIANLSGNDNNKLLYSTDEISEILEDACIRYLKGLLESASERTYYTDEEVTLYTPNKTHNCYIIRNYNGAWSVLWFEPCVLHRNNSSTFIQKHYSLNNAKVFRKDTKIGYYTETGRNGATTYVSETLTNVQDCLDVIMGKKETTYTESTSYEWVCGQDGVYPCHYVNLPVYDTSVSSDNYRKTRGISPKEKIEEIKS